MKAIVRYTETSARARLEQIFPISETTSYIVRYGLDQYERLADWAVIQRCTRDGFSWRVAVYDACHGKDVHKHLYNRNEIEIDEHPLMDVKSYADYEAGLEYATERVVIDYLENERRSERGQ